MRGHDLAALRRLNTIAVLRFLRSQGPGRPQSLSQLAAATGLSRPTVDQVVEELTAQGWLTEASDPSAGRSGRPARRFRFRGEAGRVVGVDIGLHKVVLLLSDLAGDVTASHREEMDPEMGGAERLAFLRARIERFLDDQKVPQEELWALCVGVPGVVGESGRITSVIVPEWSDFELARRLGESFPCRILAENDVNLATLAEHWQGAAQLADDVVCLLIGHRSSCGVMLGGRLHRGHRGWAGELGLHRRLGLAEAHEELSWRGERPLATSAPEAAATSAPEAVGVSAPEAVEVSPPEAVGVSPPEAGEGSDIAALARAAGEGNPEALDVLDRYAARLAPGIGALLLAVDPELVVLSGGMTPVGEALTPLLTRHLRDVALDVPLHVPRIAVSTLGEQGVALGAVRKALDSVEALLSDATGPLPSVPPSPTR
ncbi:ROK family transcriptional regulator [Streptomyces sp. WMMB 322]|uniref:ROK family transcriptional regulator n=1 Tax=Streptomyces sp. WMMB 322 TaxID=1286821 RepID=UPI000823991A|nr:ROK family transcriptional regulator [Streptomyces sp. WMMB 322]SCK13485.1 Sugar kinase of the NBD/HSP70 family, may contain an N-terminal HTH domain [Streptomyces sp. WMMB 322]